MTITQNETNIINAEFSLYPLPENPNVPRGVVLFEGNFNPDTLEMTLEGVRWLSQPDSGWTIIDFSGRFDPNLRTFTGQKHSSRCGSILLSRD